MIKRDMREEIERRLERDKRHHEEIIATLRRDLSQLTKISQECDGLKDLQKSMQQEMNSQQEKIMSLREENTQLKIEAAKMQGLHSEIEALKLENDSIKREKVALEMRSIKLKSTIAEKEQEIASLKTLIDTQYKRIKLDLTNTRDRFHNDQETIHSGMKHQNLMLAEISAAVQTISTGMGGRAGTKKDTRRITETKSTPPKSKAFIAGGKASSDTTLNKLPGYTQKKRH
jgi:chromosome segregation ATPase